MVSTGIDEEEEEEVRQQCSSSSLWLHGFFQDPVLRFVNLDLTGTALLEPPGLEAPGLELQL